MGAARVGQPASSSRIRSGPNFSENTAAFDRLVPSPFLGLNSLNLELLRTFLAVLDAGGMRRAAAALHLTQPAISARIRELEERFEAPLFERVGRRLVPTEAGRLVAAEAPALLAASEALLRRTQELAASGRGTL